MTSRSVGLKTVPRALLSHKIAVELVASHDLLLADLTGPGLHRIGTSRDQLLDGGTPQLSADSPVGKGRARRTQLRSRDAVWCPA